MLHICAVDKNLKKHIKNNKGGIEMLLSEYIGVSHEVFEAKGILDTFTELDANYYINIYALKDTKIKEFQNSFKKINSFFTDIYELICSYNNTGNMVFFDRAVELFKFPEVNELGIGLAQGNYGRGLTSKKIRENIMMAAKDIIKEGNKNPDIFMLMGLLAKGVGADYISDMIGNIIKEDIKLFTKRINNELFGNESFIYNEKKKCDCYYIPLELVDEYPLPKLMYDIDTAIRLNKDLRDFLNEELGKSFREASEKEKIVEMISFLKNKDNFDNIIKRYNEYKYTPYDFDKDDVGIVKLIKPYLMMEKIIWDSSTRNSYGIATTIANEFKAFIEKTGIYDPFVGRNGKVKERNCQSLFLIYSKKQFESCNLDLSPECNQGRGPSDFKISCGEKDKCIIELKLLSSKKYLHGVKTQIIEYAKAENCKNLIYLIFDDVEDQSQANKRIAEIKEVIKQKEKEGWCIHLVVVKIEKKPSASNF